MKTKHSIVYTNSFLTTAVDNLLIRLEKIERILKDDKRMGANPTDLDRDTQE